MKRWIVLTVAALLFCPATANAKDAWTRSYMRRDGTFVQGYRRTAPDSTLLNNYSTQGNVNLYTGKSGTVNPYKSPIKLYRPYSPRKGY